MKLTQSLSGVADPQACRVGAPSGVWVVEQHPDAAYTLSHDPDTPLGGPAEPVQHWSFSTLEQLIGEMEHITGA